MDWVEMWMFVTSKFLGEFSCFFLEVCDCFIGHLDVQEDEESDDDGQQNNQSDGWPFGWDNQGIQQIFLHVMLSLGGSELGLREIGSASGANGNNSTNWAIRSGWARKASGGVGVSPGIIIAHTARLEGVGAWLEGTDGAKFVGE